MEDVNYDPAKNHYNPVEDACWSQGQRFFFIVALNFSFLMKIFLWF